jgi:hypothetical protein
VDTAGRRAVLRRVLPRIVAPLMLFVALAAWAVASPVGAAPDDDFHLASIWCATGDEDRCVVDPSGDEVTVPSALLSASCYAFDADTSAGCQDALDFTGPADRITDRANLHGAYPPVFHAALSVFVGDDIEASVLAMRVAVVAVVVLLLTATVVLLPSARRESVVWAWAVTTVPLGMFVLSSNNPSAGAVAGVGLVFTALMGWFESSGWRRVGLALVAIASAVLAAGSRGDAALYSILAAIAAVVLSAERSRRFAVASILPAAIIVFCLTMFRVSRPVEDTTEGVEGAGLATLLARIVPALYEVPSIWAGVFGWDWGLGWLDTPMPSVVALGTLGCFVGAGIIGVGHASARKSLVLIGGGAVLLAVPTIVLVLAGDEVGSNVQPRYLLPLIVLFATVLLWVPSASPLALTLVQRVVVSTVLVAAHAVALHLNIARYTRGFDDLAVDLDAGVEWWWDIPISPLATWFAGSLAFAALIVMLLSRRVR